MPSSEAMAQMGRHLREGLEEVSLAAASSPALRASLDATIAEQSPEVAGRLRENMAVAVPEGGLGMVMRPFFMPQSPLPRPERAPPDSRKAALLARAEARRRNVERPAPEEPEPTFLFKNKPCSYPGTITTVVARQKSGKTAVVGAFIASLLAARRPPAGAATTPNSSPIPDTLGITAGDSQRVRTTPKIVFYFDIEQNEWRFEKVICRLERRARLAERTAPSWLRPYCLLGYSATDLADTISALLEQARAEGEEVAAIFLDGSAHLLESVNDDVAARRVVALMQRWAVDYRCSVINVIHENPTSAFTKSKNAEPAKPRGHLGSELLRISDTVFNIETVPGKPESVLYIGTARDALVRRDDGVFFRFDETEKMHVSVAAPTAAPTGAEQLRLATLADLAARCFEDQNPALAYGELIGRIRVLERGRGEHPLGETACGNRIRDMMTRRLIEQPEGEGGRYRLTPPTPANT